MNELNNLDKRFSELRTSFDEGIDLSRREVDELIVIAEGYRDIIDSLKENKDND